MSDDKQSVVEDVRAAYREYMDAVQGLSEQQMTTPFMGDWSVREVTGHIIGWQEQMTTGFQRMANGERPTPEGVSWSDVQSWNDKFAAGVGDKQATALVLELDSRVEAMIAALQALPDDRFGEGKTVNRMATAAAIGHFREHAPGINEARAAGKL